MAKVTVMVGDGCTRFLVLVCVVVISLDSSFHIAHKKLHTTKVSCCIPGIPHIRRDNFNKNLVLFI